MLLSPATKTYPFKLSQMIILEMFIIGLPAFFLSLQPNTERVKGRFMLEILKKALPCAVLMVMSVMLIQFLKNGLTEPFGSTIYSTMSVYTLNLAGLTCLYFVCKPLNGYRAIVYLSSFGIVIGQCLYSIFYGFPLLELVSMAPISEYWHHLIYMACVVSIEVPFYLIIEKIFSKLRLQILDKASDKLELK